MNSAEKESDFIDPGDGSTPWNFGIPPKTLLDQIVWFADKRLFAWKGLPRLAETPGVRRTIAFIFIFPLLKTVFEPIFITSKEGELIYQTSRYIKIDLNWIKIIPKDSPIEGAIIFAIDMPFSFTLIYLSTLLFAIGAVMYNIYKPAALREESVDFDAEHAKVEFRNVCLGLFNTGRQLHFANDFLKECALNYSRLIDIEEEYIERARENGDVLFSLPHMRGDERRLNKYTVYYLANRMILKEEKLTKAHYLNQWFAQETRAIIRWIIRITFIVALGATLYLLAEGFFAMFSIGRHDKI